jgi:hypothetical protein
MSETPILDLENAPPRLARPWFAWLLGGAIGGVLVVQQPVAVDFTWWFPLLYLSIALHEIGHLIAAKLVGMESGGLVIGGLVILKSGARWVVRFDWRRILSGGLAKPLPRKGDFYSARHAWMIAGGPIATVLLVVIGVLFHWNCLWVLNAILLMSCLLPSSGMNKSDGARIWLLLRNPEDSQSFMAVLQVQTQETEGILPGDWDSDLVKEMLRGGPESGDKAYRQMLAFYRCIHQGNPDAALLHLEKALAGSARCGRVCRQWCFLEAACSTALLRGDAAKARTWLQRAVKVRKPESKANVEASIAMAEGRYQDAIPLWDESLAFIAKRRGDSGLIRFTKMKIAEYREQCRERLANSAVA